MLYSVLPLCEANFFVYVIDSLRSGLFNSRKILEKGIKVGLGTGLCDYV